jgi:putative transposase
MTSKPVAFLMADLGVTKTHSRPYVSDDNPYSESQFRTMKYRPDFPDRFGSIQHSRIHSQFFFSWYNDEHRHCGIGILTPAMVHYGQAGQIIQKRQVVLDAAYLAHPERFVRSSPKPLPVPKQVWINKPIESHESKSCATSQQGQPESRPQVRSSFIRDPGAIFFPEILNGGVKDEKEPPKPDPN